MTLIATTLALPTPVTAFSTYTGGIVTITDLADTLTVAQTAVTVQAALPAQPTTK